MKRTNLRIGCLLLVLVLLLGILPVTALADEVDEVDFESNISAAILHDASGNLTDDQLFNSYSVYFGDNGAVIEASGLRKHTNGTGFEGYWVGAAFAAPEGVSRVKYYCSTSGFSGNLTEVALEKNVNTSQDDGIAFYVDAETTKQFYVAIQWVYNENKVSTVERYTFNLDVDIFKETPPTTSKYYVDNNFPRKIEIGTYQDVKVSIWGDRGVENQDGATLSVSVEGPRYSNADLWYYVGSHAYWDYWNYIDVVDQQGIPGTFDLTQVGINFPMSLYLDTAGTYKFTFTLKDANNKTLASDTATVEATYPAHDDYRIYLDCGKHGSISTRPSTWADYKDTVTIYVNPDKGYELDTLKVYDAKGNRISVYTDNHGNYYFTMPNRSVTVYATFEEVNYDHFTDVPKGSWYYDAVYYVYDHDIMDGVGNRTFNPYGDLSRAMIVTTLYRLEGEPVVRTSGTFRDVPYNTWYSDAVEWAAKEGIVKGYGKKTFGPSNSVTVEQLAAILQRYADYKGYDVDQTVQLYADAVVSQWAVKNVRWAAAEGLLRDGRSTNATLVATRAEIAYALYGFMTNVVE